MEQRTRKRVIGASIVGGTALAALGGVAAASATTGTISAAGAAIGGLAGGLIGSSLGIATGGFAAPATIPLAAAGAAIGGWAGPALALFGIGTAPAWAMLAMVLGGVLLVAAASIGVYMWLKTPAPMLAE